MFVIMWHQSNWLTMWDDQLLVFTTSDHLLGLILTPGEKTAYLDSCGISLFLQFPNFLLFLPTCYFIQLFPTALRGVSTLWFWILGITQRHKMMRTRFLIKVFLFKFKDLFYSFFRESKRAGEGSEGERESQEDCMLSLEPFMGLDPRILRSWPALRQNPELAA